VRQDDLRQEVSVSLYGEVQKEVIQATLANDFDVAGTFRETTTICIERPNGRLVTDCTVTMTHSGYWARQSHSHGVFDKSMSSTAGDFRNLTPLVLMSALTQAGTTAHEPMHRFHLELPADTLGPTTAGTGTATGRAAYTGHAGFVVPAGG
jgi:hypothetical protein